MRILLSAVFGALLVVVLATGAWALDVPPHKGYVNDLAELISPATRRILEQKLADLDRSDSTQVAVLTIPSLEGDSMNDFSIRVAEEWKVGQKGEDNGVILLVSKADRQIRIEVGYGLEGVLTDVLSGQIINNVISPQFKAGDFDAGFMDGVTAISGAVRGEFKAKQANKPRSRRGILPLLVIPMMLIIGLTEMFGRARRKGQLVGDDENDPRRRGTGLGSTASTLLLLSMLGGGRGGGGGFGGGGGGFGGFGGGGFGGGGAGGGW